jgi:hypothetical protein
MKVSVGSETKKYVSRFCAGLSAVLALAIMIGAPLVMAADPKLTPKAPTPYHCGGGEGAVYTSIDIGCAGKGNALFDMAFAIIRLLSAGVGIIIVISTVVAGIQYTTSAGDPNAVQAAIQRLANNVIALLIFIFGYAILNFIIPAGFLR